jgi:hypothetical protein
MTGQLDRGTGPRSLTEIVNNGPSQGGGFVYDEATLGTLIQRWLDLADHYARSRAQIQLGVAEPPGLDFASKDHVDAANQSGTAYMTYLGKNFEYCVRQAQLLQNTLDDYLGVEHRNVTDFLTVDPETSARPGPQAGM